MKKITIPKNLGQRYYDTHYQYINDIFLSAGYELSYNNYNDLVIEIDNKLILFDYFDNINELNITDTNLLDKIDKIFKFHYSLDIDYGIYNDKITSFSPISFYFRTESHTQYKNEIKFSLREGISNRQVAYGNAVKRRKYVQDLLKLWRCKYKFLLSKIDRSAYLDEANLVKMGVFIGGYSNNILDRGQFQYMAIGCPTISTKLPEYLAFNQKIIPNKDYILIDDNYTDLLQILDKNYNNNEYLKYIINNAKILFNETSTPNKLIEWINLNL